MPKFPQSDSSEFLLPDIPIFISAPPFWGYYSIKSPICKVGEDIILPNCRGRCPRRLLARMRTWFRYTYGARSYARHTSAPANAKRTPEGVLCVVWRLRKRYFLRTSNMFRTQTAFCKNSNNISQIFIIGIDKTNARAYSKIQIVFVKLSFSEILIFRTSIATKPSKATMPRTVQKGINLGYFTTLSNEIAIDRLNKFKRHSIPRLKSAAFANMERITYHIPTAFLGLV